MRVLDLFSGIGGMSLGLEWAGMTTAAFCEIEPFPRAVLRKHWPLVPIYDDVRTLTADRLARDRVGRIDLVCGGYPCQPFSRAGKQRGTTDPRHLWPEMRRIVGEVRPAWVLAENVAGHITLGLDQVLADLEADGYAGRAVVVPACAVDAPHIRRRVWIVARDRDRDRESACAVDAEAQGVPGDMADAKSVGRREGRPSDAAEVARGRHADGGGFCATLAHAHVQGLEGRKRGGVRERAGEFAAGPRGASVPDADSIAAGRFAEPRGERGEWLAEPGVGRVAHGVPRRVDRLRGLGNAVVPQVVAEIGRAIIRDALGSSEGRK